jgi:hypothetical protein
VNKLKGSDLPFPNGPSPAIEGISLFKSIFSRSSLCNRLSSKVVVTLSGTGLDEIDTPSSFFSFTGEVIKGSG